MSDNNDAATEFKIAYKQLVDEIGESAALDVLDDVHSEAHESATFGADLFPELTVDASEEAETESDDGHEFDVDERRMVEERDGVLVDPNGEKVRQQVQGEVEVTNVEDGWLVLDGDTYDAKGHIKAVDYQFYEFDGDRKVWLVDKTVIDDLHRNLNGGGFLLTASIGESTQECVDCGRPIPKGMFDRCSDCPAPEEQLRQFIVDTDEGDRIRVEYEQKNGEGMNDKEGEVVEQRLPEEEEFVDVRAIRFVRDDGQRMYVRPDEYGKLALYTAMSHAPFVGDVESLEVVEEA